MDHADASRLAPRAARGSPPGSAPLLIIGCVLFALRGFVVDGGLTNQHPDLLTFWLPRWSFLGDSIAAGRIPLWNPFEMVGYRFAADPQSGWLYVPPMVLFSVFSPGPALRSHRLQPIVRRARDLRVPPEGDLGARRRPPAGSCSR